jgi:regulator of sigma E protease
MFITILVFVIILGLLVFVHELGHFVVARRNGIKAEEFGFGFPPRIVGIQFLQGKKKEKVSEVESIQVKTLDMKMGKDEIIQETVTEMIHNIEKTVPVRKWRIIWGNKDGDDENEKRDLHEAHQKRFSGGTVYSLNWFPIGGFVRIKGEDGEGKKEADSFAAKSPWIRIRVLVAGVAMNFLLAWVLLSVTFMVGSYQDVTGEHVAGSKILIESIEQNSPADKMGLEIGDVIIKDGGGTIFSSVEQVQQYINSNRGKEVTLVVQRGSEQLSLSGMPRLETQQGQGALGISGLGEVVNARYPFFQSLWMGIAEIGNMFVAIFQLFGQLLHGQQTGVEVMGPVKLAVFTGQIIPLGFVYILRFIAIFSVNLGIINVLPFPALDGGRILFVLIEKIKGSPVSRKVEQAFHTVGMMLLLALMLLITLREIFTPELIARIKGIL